MKPAINPYVFLKVVFGLGLFIILCIGGFTYRHIKVLSETNAMVQHTYDVSIELERMFSRIRYADLSQRDYLISKDSLFFKTFLSLHERIPHDLARIKNLTVDNPVQQESIMSLSFDVINELNLMTETIEIAKSKDINSKEFRAVFRENKENRDLIKKKIREMIALENKLLETRQLENEKLLGITPIILYSILILTLILLLLAYAKIHGDIKSLKETNEELEIFKASSNLAEIVSKHGTWTWYVDDNIFEYSDNLYRLLGEEPKSFEPKLDTFFSYVHEDDKERLSKHVEKMMEEEELPYVSFRVVHKNGDIKHLKSYGKLLISEDGYKQILGTTTDITDEVHNYETIQKRNQELERNNKELSTFNYVASHDLQEPLRKIQTFISRLEMKDNDNLSESGKSYIEKIKSSSSRMRLLIDDLLQYSRTSNSEQQFVETNMNMLLEHAKHELSDLIIEHNVSIKSDDLPPMEVIPFQIQQLFINLLNNSIKYRRNETRPKIRINYKEVKSNQIEYLKFSLYKYHHMISFEDNGIGFDQAYADKIFVLFKRLHGKSEYSGTGIGLSICKKIVENHNGVIIAKGVPNKGATFEIYLPFLK
ncbi:CHASE3 domain-containing protein [Psychroserpens mesophilus]|uniref:CHASE3 domain-containing protein n=1 Tax=Psychroserpens mesophilus TaxID=325473 RepID=UPI003D65676A